MHLLVAFHKIVLLFVIANFAPQTFCIGTIDKNAEEIFKMEIAKMLGGSVQLASLDDPNAKEIADTLAYTQINYIGENYAREEEFIEGLTKDEDKSEKLQIKNKYSFLETKTVEGCIKKYEEDIKRMANRGGRMAVASFLNTWSIPQWQGYIVHFILICLEASENPKASGVATNAQILETDMKNAESAPASNSNKKAPSKYTVKLFEQMALNFRIEVIKILNEPAITEETLKESKANKIADFEANQHIQLIKANFQNEVEFKEGKFSLADGGTKLQLKYSTENYHSRQQFYECIKKHEADIKEMVKFGRLLAVSCFETVVDALKCHVHFILVSLDAGLNTAKAESPIAYTAAGSSSTSNSEVLGIDDASRDIQATENTSDGSSGFNCIVSGTDAAKNVIEGVSKLYNPNNFTIVNDAVVKKPPPLVKEMEQGDRAKLWSDVITNRQKTVFGGYVGFKLGKKEPEMFLGATNSKFTDLSEAKFTISLGSGSKAENIISDSLKNFQALSSLANGKETVWFAVETGTVTDSEGNKCDMYIVLFNPTNAEVAKNAVDNPKLTNETPKPPTPVAAKTEKTITTKTPTPATDKPVSDAKTGAEKKTTTHTSTPVSVKSVSAGNADGGSQPASVENPNKSTMPTSETQKHSDDSKASVIKETSSETTVATHKASPADALPAKKVREWLKDLCKKNNLNPTIEEMSQEKRNKIWSDLRQGTSTQDFGCWFTLIRGFDGNLDRMTGNSILGKLTGLNGIGENIKFDVDIMQNKELPANKITDDIFNMSAEDDLQSLMTNRKIEFAVETGSVSDLIGRSCNLCIALFNTMKCNNDDDVKVESENGSQSISQPTPSNHTPGYNVASSADTTPPATPPAETPIAKPASEATSPDGGRPSASVVSTNEATASTSQLTQNNSSSYAPAITAISSDTRKHTASPGDQVASKKVVEWFKKQCKINSNHTIEEMDQADRDKIWNDLRQGSSTQNFGFWFTLIRGTSGDPETTYGDSRLKFPGLKSISQAINFDVDEMKDKILPPNNIIKHILKTKVEKRDLEPLMENVKIEFAVETGWFDDAFGGKFVCIALFNPIPCNNDKVLVESGNVSQKIPQPTPSNQTSGFKFQDVNARFVAASKGGTAAKNAIKGLDPLFNSVFSIPAPPKIVFREMSKEGRTKLWHEVLKGNLESGCMVSFRLQPKLEFMFERNTKEEHEKPLPTIRLDSGDNTNNEILDKIANSFNSFKSIKDRLKGKQKIEFAVVTGYFIENDKEYPMYIIICDPKVSQPVSKAVQVGIAAVAKWLTDNLPDKIEVVELSDRNDVEDAVKNKTQTKSLFTAGLGLAVTLDGKKLLGKDTHFAGNFKAREGIKGDALTEDEFTEFSEQSKSPIEIAYEIFLEAMKTNNSLKLYLSSKTVKNKTTVRYAFGAVGVKCDNDIGVYFALLLKAE